jgi:hypothetical protein
MAIDVTTILKGPALVKYDGATFYSKGDISFSTAHNTMNIEVDRYGKVDERVTDDIITVSFTPAGEWESLGVVYPYLTMPIGSYITGASDKPLVLHSFAGTKITLHNAAVTKMPNIRGSSKETLLGDVEFTSFVKNNVERTTAASRYTVASEALTDTSFDPANIIVQPYTLSWGDAPWANLATKEGFSLDWSLGLTDVETDKDGIVTKQLSNLDVSVKAQVMGISEAQLLDKMLIQGAGAARGRSLNAGADNLVITGTGVYIIVYGAALKTSPQMFSRTNLRIGELEWIATRTFTAGAPNPLAFVGEEDPEA